jgi:CheY-like chemotaxis protein
LISQAVDVVRPAADAKGIALSISVEKELGTVKADKTRFHQIVWNLLTNAVKFTPRGGSIRATVACRQRLMEITVSDNGEGIDPDFLPHLFEPFRQSENPSTRVHGGLGLGLSIVRYLVEAHGGTIRASSGGRGKGAAFTFTLPLEKAHAGERQEPMPAAVRAEGRLGGVRIMVIDDDHDGRLLVKTALQQAGAEVVALESAPLAVAEFSTRPCDVVITDIAMPAMDGYELAARLRELATDRPLKVVALSAFHPQKGEPQDAFDEYLTKPIDPFSLVDAIVRVAGR